ncbi:prolipoprotein diacylglyceryl transferase [Rhodovulum tesquicola]|uniref:prolipoprotein diacylglyceryl transferase n=1 Tax=Rhodovulum tesquicola TaxID=540254 RepID=UPI002096D062|nr:prolipoprotein diacylglyceryl transferase [Rhodovulum tesquicola]MCO8144222.1 prolipoprotein diacylglyceryl transferase [Rhodovulum tesquicola]
MLGVLNFPDIGNEIFSVSLFGLEFALRWYALAYIAGLLIGWRIVVAAMRRPALWPEDRAPMRPEQVDELLTWIILGVILGGRLGFVLFYQPGHYLANPLEIPMVWQGGMAFHGGLAGVCIALVLFARRHGVPLLSAADALALATPVGLFFGRIANFINAELWGRPSDLPWAVVFPGYLAQDCPGWDMMPCARHPSQLYEAGLEGLVLGLLLVWLVRARGALRRPGAVAGVFFLGYGLARIFVELFREADPQFITPDNPLGHVVHLGGAGLSMGQLLSLPMVALGLVFLLLSRRRA